MPFLPPNQQRQSTEGKQLYKSTSSQITRTHTLLTALFPGLPGWVSRYQKGKTNLDFIATRDSEWQWHQLGHMQVCTLLVFIKPDNQLRQHPTTQFFTGRMPFPQK